MDEYISEVGGHLHRAVAPKAIGNDPSNTTQRVYRDIVKRPLDLILSLILLAPLLIIIGTFSLLIRRGGCSGIYAQQRVGKDGKQFECYKLRTMVCDAEEMLQQLCAENPALAQEWEDNQKLENDPRVTRIGRFLRATSLDELPQIFNVIKGDMSLIGPRPFMASQDEMYWNAGGRAYYRGRPGVSGPWQIEGRGQTTFLSRIQFDEAFEREMSLTSDVGYMLKTAGVVFRRTGH